VTNRSTNGATGKDERVGHRALGGAQWNAHQIEHRQHVDKRDLVLQREADHVEGRQRRKGLQAVERHLVFAELLFHVGPGREDALAGPIVAGVHQRVEHLQPVVAHADGVGVGEGEAEFSPHITMVLADHVQLAAQILGRRLHLRQQPADNVVFQTLVEHGLIMAESPPKANLSRL
jgi:hypothetical protein